MEKTEYRNSIRSRKLICEALLELMNEKPLEKITVTDIAKRADVNRGTFYLHYDNINDVISELQNALIAQMDQYFSDLDIPLNEDNIVVLLANCMKYIYSNNQTSYVPLLFHQQLNFANKVCQSFQTWLLSSKDAPKEESTQKELLIRASLWVHGVIGVFNASANGILDVSQDTLSHSIDTLIADMQGLLSRTSS